MKIWSIMVTVIFSLQIFASSDFGEQLQEDLILAEPGTVIELPEGQFEIDSQLSLTVDNVTIKGMGMDKTILSFKNQVAGAEGFNVAGNGITFEGLTIQDTKGDGIKVTRSMNLTIRDVKVEWTAGPKIENGGYGFYPVQCSNVLIENSVVSGASDAGIYVGQSKNIIVRKNHVLNNVAGIEIENSQDADVYENLAENNTGGILVFDMPDLSQKGIGTRVFNNTVRSNNLKNFAPPANHVAETPTGTGIMIMSTDKVEIFGNKIFDNDTTGILITTYLVTGRSYEDKNYDPFPESIFIYDNEWQGGGVNPQGGSSQNSKDIVEFVRDLIDIPFPNIIFDGSYNQKLWPEGNIPLNLKICIRDEASFINLNVFTDPESNSRDKKPHDCEHELLNPIVL